MSRVAKGVGIASQAVGRSFLARALFARVVKCSWAPWLAAIRGASAIAAVLGHPAFRSVEREARWTLFLVFLIDVSSTRAWLAPFRFDLIVWALIRSLGRSTVPRREWFFFIEGAKGVGLPSEWEEIGTILATRYGSYFVPLFLGAETGPTATGTLGYSIWHAKNREGGVLNREVERGILGESEFVSRKFRRLWFLFLAPAVRAVVAQQIFARERQRPRVHAMGVNAAECTDVHVRLQDGELRRQLEKAGELDPSVFLLQKERSVVSYAYLADPIENSSAYRNLLEQVGDRPARAVVVIPHCRFSGAARVAAEVCHALAGRLGPEEILLLQTDLSDFAVPHWFPPEVRRVDFFAATREVDPNFRKRMMAELLRMISSEVVVNVNSGGFWRMHSLFGTQLSREMRIYSYFFCSDRNEEGREVGYPVTYFIEALEHHAGVLFDSEYLKAQMEERYRIAGWNGRTAVLYTPANPVPRPGRGERKEGRQPTVFWCGRLDPQKRFDIVVETAKKMPDCRFRVWGKRILGSDEFDRLPPNISMEGTFSKPTELPFDDFDLWLYTSEWEGIPTILLDLASVRMPLVTSYHTGLTDLFEPDHACLVETLDSDDYVEAIRKVLADPADAQGRAERFEAFVSARHTRARFSADLLEALGFPGEESSMDSGLSPRSEEKSERSEAAAK